MPTLFKSLLIFTSILIGNGFASGFLTLETTPSGVEVWYSTANDTQKKYLGDSPLDSRELPAGTYDLWLIQGGKDTVNIPGVVISEGQHSHITHEMPANYGSLKVLTDPDSGEVWLDSVKLGNSPYSNNLVIPGSYTLRLVPREAQYRTQSEKLTVKKGDTLNYVRPFSFRDKSFMEENLSVRPWAVQLEAGYQYGSAFGIFDSLGKRHNSQKSDQRLQNDFPVTARIGFPYGLETHFQLPFHGYDNKSDTAPFPRDLNFGLKYTLRPYGIGLDADYSVGTSFSSGGFNHNRLAITLIGVHPINKVLILGNGGYVFHFSDKDSTQLDPGDELFLNARIGYAADAFLPYLGVLVHYGLDGTNRDSTVAGGNVISLEPGLIFDVDDLVSLQLGIPFAVMGKNTSEYWAIHLSLAVRFGFK